MSRHRYIVSIDGQEVAEIADPKVDNFFIFGVVKWRSQETRRLVEIGLDAGESLVGDFDGLPVEIAGVMDDLIELRRILPEESSE